MISGSFKSCNFQKYKKSFTLSPENSKRDGSGSSLFTFHTRTNLNLNNIPVTLKMDEKFIVAVDSSNMYVPHIF